MQQYLDSWVLLSTLADRGSPAVLEVPPLCSAPLRRGVLEEPAILRLCQGGFAHPVALESCLAAGTDAVAALMHLHSSWGGN